MVVSKELSWLEYKGTGRILVELLKEERFVSWFYKGPHNPDGIGSSATVIRARNRLVQLGFIEEYESDESIGRNRIYLRLTDKGERIAQHLRAIIEIMQED